MLKSIKKRKAIKNHKCKGCPDLIERGQSYAEVVMLDPRTNRHATLKYYAKCYERHERAEEDYYRNEMQMDHLSAMRTLWDGAFQ